MRPDTRFVRFEAAPGDPYRPLATPIYQTATFAQTSALDCGPYDYSRSGNPTRRVLEDQLARLEGGARGLAFASGMAAISAVARLSAAGRRRIVTGDDIYGGTHRLLGQLCRPQGIEVEQVDPAGLEALARALARPTDLVLLETPTNPLQRICDLREVARLCQGAGALLAVDNSLMSPVLQRPLELGADLVIHSATKFLGGHGDLTAGAVIAREQGLGERLAFVQNAEGNALNPFESFLLLRGLKTVGLRVRRQQANARVLAERLTGHPLVTRVHYPGLEDHPGRALHLRQAEGPGALVSFETGDLETSRAVVEGCRMYSIAVSFGSVGSQISLPCRMSHASIPDDERSLPPDLVRISVGIEDPADLLEDLEQALQGAQARAARALALEEPGSR